LERTLENAAVAFWSQWLRKEIGSSGRTLLSKYPDFPSVEGKTVSLWTARKNSIFTVLLRFLNIRFLLESGKNIRKY
jgi:hypothetical protein